MSLYSKIGDETLKAILSKLYLRCFEDVMIGHFFFEKDHDKLLEQQFAFTSSMLGGPRAYTGRPLVAVHGDLHIRPAHFARRRVILKETMEEFGLEQPLIEAWLAHEERLRPLIMATPENCR